LAGISSRWVRWEMRSASATKSIVFMKQPASIVGAVGLISIHLAFYQMNPWPTALRRILNLWKPLSSTPVGIFCCLAEVSETILKLFLHAVQTNVGLAAV
jgi:hypothetical protein